MIVYIAGKITGDPCYRKKFSAAKSYLESQGHTVLNPAELPFGLEYKNYMNIGFEMLRASQAVYMLKDWIESAGAIQEHTLAKVLQLNIWYEGGRVKCS